MKVCEFLSLLVFLTSVGDTLISSWWFCKNKSVHLLEVKAVIS